ncbi:hypothetical protein BOTBODRAFT_234652 [Botryobasidium botryosum FD-172 SS1]|uniref:Uncharacterized protein n=1 Tax=Botryobasidium botryosum (strain FD-172 SS1) TaxID=930990 RepID=A0A067LUK2_BOTB1|nr:hypothetical protein BOTBODRAFT_234652 [Botryobasidium botryosum FD-172 SS1]
MSQVQTLTTTETYSAGAAAADALEAAARKRAEAAAVDAAIATATAALQAATPSSTGVTPAPVAPAAPATTSTAGPSASIAPAPAAANTIVAYGATDVSSLPDEALQKWLRTHHNAESGDFISVVQERSGNNINWSWGPFVLNITISFTGVTGEFGVNIPFWGYKKLVDINGDLITGVGAGFDIGFVSGNIKLYLKGRQVFFEIHAQAFGQQWDRTVALVTL